ncbi:MAG: hypothetical protein R6U10_02500 [Thermoplasmatota archaeon]
MAGTPDFARYIHALDRRLHRYIVPEPWNPAEEALYRPDNLFEVPGDEADDMRLRAIRHAFRHHYDNNAFYRSFCRDREITPDDVTELDDLASIPLIPDKFFKNYPPGEDFARWIATLYTGELPEVTVAKRNPSYDDVVTALNDAGMHIAYSSGTSGRHTFIPRDEKTFLLSEYPLR